MPFEPRNQKATMLRRTPAPNAVSPGVDRFADPFVGPLGEKIDAMERRVGAYPTSASFT
jgi:hypothetical protein